MTKAICYGLLLSRFWKSASLSSEMLKFSVAATWWWHISLSSHQLYSWLHSHKLSLCTLTEPYSLMSNWLLHFHQHWAIAALLWRETVYPTDTTKHSLTNAVVINFEPQMSVLTLYNENLCSLRASTAVFIIVLLWQLTAWCSYVCDLTSIRKAA